MLDRTRSFRFTAVLMVAWFICPASLKADASDRFAMLGDVKVHYRTVGSGPETLVFVHGWTCDAGFWREQLEAFPEQRVIAIDLPGHGQSDKPRIDYTIPLFAEAIEAVMRDAQVERAVLVGHSMGAPVVREFYRRFPEKTSALVVVDGALRAMFSRAQSEQLQERLRSDYAGTARRMVDGMLTAVRNAELRDDIRAVMLGTPDYVGRSAMQSLADEAIYHADPIKVPLLVLLAKSPFWPPETEQFFRSLAPEADFHVMQGVSHFLMLEKPDELNALLRNFLAKQREMLSVTAPASTPADPSR
ncbi:MAG TPA: alpha/beta hydrolase [Chthoniobacterales bacterium]